MEKIEEVKDIVHDAFGDYVKNIQLSTEDYATGLQRVARAICRLFELESDSIEDARIRQLERHLVLVKAESDGYASELLDLQKDCIAKDAECQEKMEKIYGWGSEICHEHYDKILKRGGQPRRCCYQCWQALKKQGGIKEEN